MSPGPVPELAWSKTDASSMGLEEQDTMSVLYWGAST